MSGRPIVLLTDFGLADAYVGVVKSVIRGRLPGATLIDLCHTVPAQDVRHAAFLLATSVRYLPQDSVVLAVVDPGVGSGRRAVAVDAGERTFLAPDNGLLSWALRLLAGVSDGMSQSGDGWLHLAAGWSAVQLDQPAFWLPEISSTFHGRDIFAPVAAAVAGGVPICQLGTGTRSLVALDWPEPATRPDGSLLGAVVAVDTYGNLFTSLRLSDLPPEPLFEIGGREIRGLSEYYQVASPLVALVGSTGLIEIAAPNSSAAHLLDLGRDAPIVVRSRSDLSTA